MTSTPLRVLLAAAVTTLALAPLAGPPARADLLPPPAAEVEADKTEPDEPDASEAEGRCASPQQALYTVLYWLQPERFDRARAAACLDRTGLVNPEQDALRLAESVKVVLDKKDVWVRWRDIPAQADFVDGAGEPRFELYPGKLDGFVIQKIRGRWLITRDTLEKVADWRAELEPPPDVGGLGAMMPEWLKTPVLGVQAWQIVGLFILIFLGILLRKIVIYVFARYLRKAANRFSSKWLEKVIAKADRPVGGLVMALVLTAGLPILRFGGAFADFAAVAIRTLAAFSAVWLIYRLVDVLADNLAERAAKTDTKLDDQLVPLLRKSMKLFTVVLGVIFILQNLHVDVGSLLAGLGLGGLAFALAAKDTVANFFGSVMIFIDKPFQIGDWIVMSPNIEGTVEEVGFRTSRIRTFYNSVITVPNANVTNTAVDNMGARRYRRYKTVLSLTYDTPPEKVQAFCEGVRAIIQDVPGTRRDFYMVEFQEFGAHSLDVLLYMFFEVPDWAAEMRAKTRVNLEILRLAAALGVEFAFPTQTLHIASVAKPGEGVAPTGPVDPKALAEVVDAFGPDGAKARPTALVISKGYEASSNLKVGTGE